MAEKVSALQDVRAQFAQFFNSLSLGKRITLVASLVTIFIGMLIFIVFSRQDTWAPLYSNLDPTDAARLVEKLQENQINYMLAPGGRTVMVQPSNVDKARLILAREKVLPGSGVGFLDLFSKPELGATEFDQQVKFRVAQEGELARLITRINTIKTARVSLALPKKTIFNDSQEQATASVSLETHGDLNRSQIETVIHLVASAVEGLRPNAVRVTDQYGKLLSNQFSEDGGSGKISENYAYKRKYEQELEQKLLNQLEPIIGEDRVRVLVSAEIDFDKQKIQDNLIDPDQLVTISEQLVNENSVGSRSLPVGPAGVTSNLPEATGREAATVSEHDKKNSTRNFEVSRSQVIKERAVGQLKRLTVSVLVDHKHPPLLDDSGNIIGRQNVPWTTSEKDQIANLVKAAIGFSTERKDEVVVENIPFGKPVEEDVKAQIEEAERTRAFIMNIVRYVLLGIAILLLILLVIRPMVQRLSAKPADLDLLMGLPATIGELEGEELEIPTEREAGIPSRDKIIEIARQDVLKTATMVRAWLRERK